MAIQMQMFSQKFGVSRDRNDSHEKAGRKEMEKNVASSEVVGRCGDSGVVESITTSIALGVVCTEQSNDSRNKRATKAQLLSLVEKQRYLCATCGTFLSPEIAEIDHVIPRVDGGGHEVENLQWLCVRCNRAKGTMRHGQFLELCERVTRHNASPG